MNTFGVRRVLPHRVSSLDDKEQTLALALLRPAGGGSVSDSRPDAPPFLRLAGVLVDDVRGDGLLLLLLLPHQQDALMDEDVLLLDRRRGRGCESWPESSGLRDIKETSKAHLGLDHGQPVRAHL